MSGCRPYGVPLEVILPKQGEGVGDRDGGALRQGGRAWSDAAGGVGGAASGGMEPAALNEADDLVGGGGGHWCAALAALDGDADRVAA